jgi:hypothetical protein
MSQAQSAEKTIVRVDCDLLKWGWKALRVPSNPSQPYLTIIGIIGFRVEENGKFTLYEFKEPMPLRQFTKLCEHIRSEISLCPTSYFICSNEIFKYVKKSK